MKYQMVLSVGMPRAGSGWFYNLTHDLVIANGGADARTIRNKYQLGKILTEVNCNIGSLDFYRLIPVLIPSLLESRYVIKVHAGRRPFADWLIAKDIICPTFIYRDPRDALLSAYEYGRRMRENSRQNAFTPLMTIEDAIVFMEEYVQIARGWLDLEGVFTVKYEELLSDYQRVVKGLVSFLGIDPNRSRVQDVLSSYRPNQGRPDQQGTHFVKGKIGRHRDHFTDQQLLLCDRKFGAFIRQQGYDI